MSATGLHRRRGRTLRTLASVSLAPALLIAGLAACGSGSGDAARTTIAQGASSQPEEVASGAGSKLPSGAEDLVGRWAHYDVVAYEDDLMKTLIISTGFADLELRDGTLWNRQRFCHADMGNDLNMDVSLSDTATRAIVPIDTPVEVTEVDGKLRVVRPPTPTAIGIDLEDPANEALPTDPKDPRVADDDGDGHPGVTAEIKSGEDFSGQIYIARREIFSYDVTQQSPDRMTGFITDQSEQLVVGASDEIFLTQSEWKQIDDKTRNPVIWVRVPSDWDCERLASERATLFPAKPKADW